MDLTLHPAVIFRFRGGVIAMAAAVAGVRRRAAGEVGQDGTGRDATLRAPLRWGREAAGQGLLRRDDAARSPRRAGLGAPSPPRAQRAPAASPCRAGAPAPRPARGPVYPRHVPGGWAPEGKLPRWKGHKSSDQHGAARRLGGRGGGNVNKKENRLDALFSILVETREWRKV